MLSVFSGPGPGSAMHDTGGRLDNGGTCSPPDHCSRPVDSGSQVACRIGQRARYDSRCCPTINAKTLVVSSQRRATSFDLSPTPNA